MDFESELELKEFKLVSNCLLSIRSNVEFMLDVCDFKLFPTEFYLKCRTLLLQVIDCQNEYAQTLKFSSRDNSKEIF